MSVTNRIVGLLVLFSVSCFNVGNASRYQYRLQLFDIKHLKVFTTVNVSKDFYYGVIIDPDGYLHTVVIGDYIGKHNGKVVSINADLIEIDEVHASGDNEWVEKKVFLKRKNSKGK